MVDCSCGPAAIAKVLYGGRKKYQAARAESSAIRIAGPRPRKNATRRIAGRKTIKPRSEILINQLSSKPRTEKLTRNAARAMVYRHATLCVAVRSHPLLDLRTACPLALMGNSRSDGSTIGLSAAERLRFQCHVLPGDSPTIPLFRALFHKFGWVICSPPDAVDKAQAHCATRRYYPFRQVSEKP